jgi:hypothetical protein
MDTMMHIIIPLSVYYMLKAYIRGPKICVWAAFIFFFKKMDWVKGSQDKKKRSKQCFCIVHKKDPLLILLSSPLHCALKCVKTLHLVVTICEIIIVHVHMQPFFNMGQSKAWLIYFLVMGQSIYAHYNESIRYCRLL